MNKLIEFSLMSIIYALPVLSLIFLIQAFHKKHLNYALAAVWCSLIAIIMHYQLAGGEIIGNYFNYPHAALYTVNIVLFVLSGLYSSVLLRVNMRNKITAGILSLFVATITTACMILLINVWINASFISQRFEKTPIMQVAALNRSYYCSYSHVFIKITPKAEVAYLCPTGYGIIASTGTLKTIPAFIRSSLPKSTVERLKTANSNWQ